MKSCSSLDAPCCDDQDYCLLDTIPMECDIEDNILKEEQRELKKKVFSVPEDNRDLIISFYGLFGNDVVSGEEIAKRLNVSVLTVSYRKKIIQQKLRSMMVAWAS